MAYKTHTFKYGDVLTHEHMNNIIEGIDQSLNNMNGNIKKSINKNINFVGMSIWANDNRDKGNGLLRGYQTLLKEQFIFKSTKDYVYSGNSLGGISNTDGSSIMIQQAKSWSASSNAIWTLDTITNDHARNIPLGTIDDYNNATGALTYYGALRAFKDKVEQLSGTDAIVICANAVPRNAWGGYDKANANGTTPRQYEYALMEVCALNDWYFVNQYQNGSCVPNVILCTYDGTHLNNMGYRLAVKPWIEQFDIIANILSNTIEPEPEPEASTAITDDGSGNIAVSSSITDDNLGNVTLSSTITDDGNGNIILN